MRTNWRRAGCRSSVRPRRRAGRSFATSGRRNGLAGRARSRPKATPISPCSIGCIAVVRPSLPGSGAPCSAKRPAARGAGFRTRAQKPAMEALLAASLTASLTEREAKQVMALYGIPVVADALVQSASAACEAAAKVGFPVVLKGERPNVLHKTEGGLVKLGLRTAPEVERAFNDIERAVAAMSPRPDFRGVVVQPMIPKGVEVMVGARHDPQFGPLVVVGLGGVLVEVLRDTALSLAPVGPSEAEVMLRGLKGSGLLNGFRSAPAVVVPRLAEIVCRFSELAADAGGDVSEMEINPLICAGDRIVAGGRLFGQGGAADALLARRTDHGRRRDGVGRAPGPGSRPGRICRARRGGRREFRRNADGARPLPA